MRSALGLRSALLSVLVCCGTGLLASDTRAQNLFPPGTIIPVALEHSISSKTTKPGQAFRARVTQDVPLPDRGRIRAGSHVLGHVVEVIPPSGESGARISLKIDTLAVSGRTMPLRVSLRAIASPMEVEDAQVPVEGSDRGTPPSAYTTIQVGGDVVYRGGGHVERHGLIVGEPVPDGVLALVSDNPDRQCPDDAQGNGLPQALWVFSSDACGVYGYAGVKIVDAGRTSPDGTIVIAANRGQLDIRGGSGMLLPVEAPRH